MRRTSPNGAKLELLRRGIPSQGIGCNNRGDPSHSFGMTCKKAQYSPCAEVQTTRKPYRNIFSEKIGGKSGHHVCDRAEKRPSGGTMSAATGGNHAPPARPSLSNLTMS